MVRDEGLKGNIVPRDEAARWWTLVFNFERPRDEANRILPFPLPFLRHLHPPSM